jgi:hypothetical protein
MEKVEIWGIRFASVYRATFRFKLPAIEHEIEGRRSSRIKNPIRAREIILPEVIASAQDEHVSNVIAPKWARGGNLRDIHFFWAH